MSLRSGDVPGAVIFGCAGGALTADEAELFRSADPLGFILFARNCQTPEQVADLVAQLRDTVGRADAPVLIDQEGGSVRRLRPPHGDRAFADAPAVVAELAQSFCDGLLAGGVLPVVKHMPGHGRATVDSHHEVPRVTASAATLVGEGGSCSIRSRRISATSDRPASSFTTSTIGSAFCL